MKKNLFVALLISLSFQNCLVWFMGGDDTLLGDQAIEKLMLPAYISTQYKIDNGIPFETGDSLPELLAPAFVLKSSKIYYKKDVNNCSNLIIGLPQESTIKILGLFCHFD